MPNNSPKKLNIHEATENASSHVREILRVLEEIIKNFTISVDVLDGLTTISLHDNNTPNKSKGLRVISLEIYSKPKSYVMTLYHYAKSEISAKPVYEIKVKGNYELKALKSNLEKLIKGENLRHRTKFYPF